MRFWHGAYCLHAARVDNFIENLMRKHRIVLQVGWFQSLVEGFGHLERVFGSTSVHHLRVVTSLVSEVGDSLEAAVREEDKVTATGCEAIPTLGMSKVTSMGLIIHHVVKRVARAGLQRKGLPSFRHTLNWLCWNG